MPISEAGPLLHTHSLLLSPSLGIRLPLSAGTRAWQVMMSVVEIYQGHNHRFVSLRLLTMRQLASAVRSRLRDSRGRAYRLVERARPCCGPIWQARTRRPWCRMANLGCRSRDRRLCCSSDTTAGLALFLRSLSLASLDRVCCLP